MSKQENTKDKTRVYEYAKSLNMSSKEIITILKRLNIPVNNHMSVMENDAVGKVESYMRTIKENAQAKREGNSTSQPQVNISQTKTSEVPDKTASQPARKTSQQADQRDSHAGQQQQMQRDGRDHQREGNRGGRNERQERITRGGGHDGQKDHNRQGEININMDTRQGNQQGNMNGQEQRRSGEQQHNQGNRSNGQQRQGQGAPRQGGGPRQGQGGNSRPGQGGAPRQGGQGNGPRQGGASRPGGQGGAPRQGGQGGQGGAQRQGQGGGSRPGQGSQQSSGQARFAQGGQQRQGDQARAGQGGQQRPNRNFGERSDDFSGGRNQSRNNNNNNNNNKRRFDDNRNGGGMRGRGGKNRGRNNQQQVQREKIDNTPKKIIVRGAMTVGELAKLLHKDASEVIKKFLLMGVMATINQEVDLDTIQLIADEFKVEVDLKLPVSEDPFEETVEKEEDAADLVERPAVVTIMGHVDHGKTTLLDSIRKTNVTGGEAGGITQHIGAYQVEFNSKKITFLDTPGHEAFTLMRARGAQVTDITIIVVAADDGVMPQTVEAISHAKAANCPIIVAVNKVDKPEANVDRVKQELTEYELVPEEWGGDTIFVNVSAKQRTGLEELLEMILLVSEVNEFKANPNKEARGTVLEAELDKGRGPVARILVQQGTLKVGDPFVAGTCFGRVRAMVNDRGRRLKEAGPSTPIEITGLTDVPQAGDMFVAFDDERKARSIAEKRSTTYRESQLGANTRVTLDDLFKHIKDGEMKELNVIIKGDVQGSVEALRGSLEKIEVEGVRVKIIHSGAGAITESDVILATASSAIVIGFNVRPDAQAKITAEQEQVDIRLHRVIYSIVEEIEQAMKGMLDPEYKEVVIGHAEVRNTFKISKVGTIAGCMVTEGKISRSAEVRLVRDGIVVHEGKIDSLKRFKDDAKEVAQGYECGIMLEKYNDMKEGDIIEAFVMETIERK
ncbi:translation initiation factor IF-2 [Paenibacillus alvei]|uniref:translation initiation factor IF-2 n=1 Tax=Paenibacillus alvei TaxID=44250 RepID=UPI0018CD6E6B|nr:translation initiation factor IF-2 [Paenibacillus alvei]MBG9733211.1 translation initiation factor IF-2 [Paenibacillus alvei]MBG9745229.1 translation initiation factor IF-2 [Paenibacillus alvei]MCY9580626.1 translation initiation factor IF-2 [Paenibacillus alvei]MCY9585109.1 translation initiation factor IF-2 [Paenibacillus alvei]